MFARLYPRTVDSITFLHITYHICMFMPSTSHDPRSSIPVLYLQSRRNTTQDPHGLLKPQDTHGCPFPASCPLYFQPEQCPARPAFMSGTASLAVSWSLQFPSSSWSLSLRWSSWYGNWGSSDIWWMSVAAVPLTRRICHTKGLCRPPTPKRLFGYPLR
jgi:hypothetical protein